MRLETSTRRSNQKPSKILGSRNGKAQARLRPREAQMRQGPWFAVDSRLGRPYDADRHWRDNFPARNTRPKMNYIAEVVMLLAIIVGALLMARYQEAN